MTSVFAYLVQIVHIAELLTEVPMAGEGLGEKLGSETSWYVALALPAG